MGFRGQKIEDRGQRKFPARSAAGVALLPTLRVTFLGEEGVNSLACRRG
jgi:hypothetical protein